MEISSSPHSTREVGIGDVYIRHFMKAGSALFTVSSVDGDTAYDSSSSTTISCAELSNKKRYELLYQGDPPSAQRSPSSALPSSSPSKYFGKHAPTDFHDRFKLYAAESTIAQVYAAPSIALLPPVRRRLPTTQQPLSPSADPIPLEASSPHHAALLQLVQASQQAVHDMNYKEQTRFEQVRAEAAAQAEKDRQAKMSNNVAGHHGHHPRTSSHIELPHANSSHSASSPLIPSSDGYHFSPIASSDALLVDERNSSSPSPLLRKGSVSPSAHLMALAATTLVGVSSPAQQPDSSSVAHPLPIHRRLGVSPAGENRSSASPIFSQAAPAASRDQTVRVQSGTNMDSRQHGVSDTLDGGGFYGGHYVPISQMSEKEFEEDMRSWNDFKNGYSNRLLVKDESKSTNRSGIARFLPKQSGSAGVADARPCTANYEYLQSCAKESLNPWPLLTKVEDPESPTLNLKGLGIGAREHAFGVSSSSSPQFQASGYAAALGLGLRTGTLNFVSKLNLSDNRLGPSATAAVLSGLRDGDAKMLRELYLDGNRLLIPGGNSVASFVLDCKGLLQTLSIANCEVSDSGANAILKAIVAANAELEASRSTAGAASAKKAQPKRQSLAASTSGSSRRGSLSPLTISEGGLEPGKGGSTPSGRVSPTSQTASAKRGTIKGGVSMSDAPSPKASESPGLFVQSPPREVPTMSASSGLVSLNLRGNQLSVSCLPSLVSCLYSCKSLSFLDVSWNSFLGAGVAQLFAALPKATVTTLNVEWNGASEKGANAVLSFLKGGAGVLNSSGGGGNVMKRLVLGNNKFLDDTVRSIKDAAKEACPYTMLDFGTEDFEETDKVMVARREREGQRKAIEDIFEKFKRVPESVEEEDGKKKEGKKSK